MDPREDGRNEPLLCGEYPSDARPLQRIQIVAPPNQGTQRSEQSGAAGRRGRFDEDHRERVGLFAGREALSNAEQEDGARRGDGQTLSHGVVQALVLQVAHEQTNADEGKCDHQCHG